MAETTAPPAAIDLTAVGVRKGNDWPLREISWTLPMGTTAAILGPNGSGKSSLLRVITGYWYPTEGQVAVLGQEFGRCDLHALRQQLRLVAPPGPFDFDARQTVREIVLTGFKGTLLSYDEQPPLGSAEQAAADRALQLVALERLADRAYGVLSTGERMRAQVARALVTQPRLLLLDEPTAGLDIPGRELLLSVMEQVAKTTTLVMVTHHPEELLAGTQAVLLLDQGRVGAAGPPEAVLEDAVLSKVYGVPLTVSHESGRFWVRVRRH